MNILPFQYQNIQIMIHFPWSFLSGSRIWSWPAYLLIIFYEKISCLSYVHLFLISLFIRMTLSLRLLGLLFITSPWSLKVFLSLSYALHTLSFTLWLFLMILGTSCYLSCFFSSLFVSFWSFFQNCNFFLSCGSIKMRIFAFSIASFNCFHPRCSCFQFLWRFWTWRYTQLYVSLIHFCID
jgi:hypothetical protein